MINMDDTGSLGQVNDNFEDDIETQDFDDLIFALKTGGHFDPTEDEKPTSERQEHFELRRISIPDTHLWVLDNEKLQLKLDSGERIRVNFENPWNNIVS